MATETEIANYTNARKRVDALFAATDQPDNPMTFRWGDAGLSPPETLGAIRATQFGPLLLAAGAPLSIQDSGLARDVHGNMVPYYPDYGNLANDEEIFRVDVRGWRWEYTDSAACQLDILLRYSSPDKVTATQELCVWLSRSGNGSICRDVSMMEYAETGYEGHNQTCMKDITDQDVADFITLFDTVTKGSYANTYE